MTELRAVIDARYASNELLMRPILGVPLVLWSFAALRRVLNTGEIALVCNDPGVLGAAAHRGLHALGPRSAGTVLSVDPAQPFCREQSLRQALDQDAESLSSVQTGAIERIRISDEDSCSLAKALALGLDPDDPHIAGITHMRLPFSTEIRAVVSDVDGVLTDGGIAYADQPDAQRSFNTHDGMGTKLLMDAGIKVGWLSATSSGASILRRAKQTGVELVDAGPGDKGPRFKAMCAKAGVPESQTLYLGDDVNDLPAMARAGLSACPSDARPEVRASVDLVLNTPGGRGAFREIADILLAGRHLT